jgi:polyhydroxyalkanoate synthesis regulator phasin
MCIACLEYVKGGMTAQEAKHAIDEMDRIREDALYGNTSEFDNIEDESHIQSVLDELEAGDASEDQV